MTSTPSHLRQVHLSESAAAAIYREASQSRDGNETGGILLGHLRDGIAEIRTAGGPGPVAVRKPTFFLRDLDHARRLAGEAFARDGSVWIGEWHTHPSAAPVPSTRDLHTYSRLLADPDLGFEAMVAIILTATDSGWVDLIARAWICSPSRTETVPLVTRTTPDESASGAGQGGPHGPSHRDQVVHLRGES